MKILLCYKFGSRVLDYLYAHSVHIFEAQDDLLIYFFQSIKCRSTNILIHIYQILLSHIWNGLISLDPRLHPAACRGHRARRDDSKRSLLSPALGEDGEYAPNLAGGARVRGG